MARLPKVGDDKGTWGNILNDFLAQAHGDDGTLKTDSVGAPQLKPQSVTNAAIADGTIQEGKLSSSVQAKLDAPMVLADGSVTTAKLEDHAVTPIKLAALGQADGIASLDTDGRLPEAQVPTRLGESNLAETIDAQSELGPAKGTAPRLSTRLNLGVPHTLPPIATLTPPLSGSIPRLNVNTVTGISSAVTWPVLADNTGAARWSGPVRVVTQTLGGVTGCVIMQDLRSPATQGTAGIKWEFDTDAPNFALDGAWGASSLLIFRDGEMITEGAIAAPGNRYYRVLAYEYTGFHRYEVHGGPGLGLASIITGPNDTVRAPIEPKPLVGFMTDSYGSTFTPITGTSHIGLVGTICRLMNWRPRTSIEGGSGYVTDGAGAADSNFMDRLPGFDGVDLDAMVFLGGRNDATAGLQTAATAVIQAFQADHPGVPVIVAGPWAPSTSWESGSQSGNFAALEAAADATGAIYVNTSGIVVGEGDITANPGVTGNGSRMIQGAHPTPPSSTDAAYIADGRQYHGYEFSRRLARQIGGY